MPPIEQAGPSTSPGRAVRAPAAGLLGLGLGLVAGVLAGLVHDRDSVAVLLLESWFFRFGLFLAAVACGRAARTAGHAAISGLSLAVGAYAAMTATDLLRGLPAPYELLVSDWVTGVVHLLWVVVLPLAGVLLAHLTRRAGPTGDLAAAVLIQGQSVPAVLALLAAAPEECCVLVEWGHPWHDWAGLALAVALVPLLRPTPGGRLRALLGGALLTALLWGAMALTGTAA
ncbi:hypothetical protein [Nonomuraea africana]|uniref:Uncharacterized protein n=1 Tax=Nonomuraea africana TaxID=46171 RepID=A0ABR9K5M8_9ACTN|nr:hypothetical protein [Nonomuraea africana]MBE1557324.1 hypothetical protein [Nonomuraea africana]